MMETVLTGNNIRRDFFVPPFIHDFVAPQDVEKTLNEHGYEVISMIGKGGFAECYLIFSKRYSMSFACKVISTDEFSKSKIKKQSSVNEYEVLSTVFHPNIVQCFEVFMSDNRIYLILEYCPYGDLHDYVKKNGPITNENQLLKIISSMLKALEYLESKKIAHNDIKPSNFLIDQHGRLKLTDFGLSKTVIDDSFLSTNFSGSLPFLAPELARKQPYNPFKTDIWAFGVTIYYLATGSFPFNSNSLSSLKQSIQYGTYSLNLKMGQTVKDIIMQCLQIDPYKRPSISELSKMVNLNTPNDFIKPKKPTLVKSTTAILNPKALVRSPSSFKPISLRGKVHSLRNDSILSFIPE